MVARTKHGFFGFFEQDWQSSWIYRHGYVCHGCPFSISAIFRFDSFFHQLEFGRRIDKIVWDRQWFQHEIPRQKSRSQEIDVFQRNHLFLMYCGFNGFIRGSAKNCRGSGTSLQFVGLFDFGFYCRGSLRGKSGINNIYQKKIIFRAKIHIFLFRTINFLNCCFCDSRIFWIQDLTIFCVTCNKTTERLLKVDHVALIMEKIFTRCIEELRMHLEGIFWWQLLLWLSGTTYSTIQSIIGICEFWMDSKIASLLEKVYVDSAKKEKNAFESWMQLKKLANSVHSIFWSLIVLMKNWWFWKRHKLPLSPK